MKECKCLSLYLIAIQLLAKFLSFSYLDKLFNNEVECKISFIYLLKVLDPIEVRGLMWADEYMNIIVVY